MSAGPRLRVEDPSRAGFAQEQQQPSSGGEYSPRTTHRRGQDEAGLGGLCMSSLVANDLELGFPTTVGSASVIACSMLSACQRPLVSLTFLQLLDAPAYRFHPVKKVVVLRQWCK